MLRLFIDDPNASDGVRGTCYACLQIRHCSKETLVTQLTESCITIVRTIFNLRSLVLFSIFNEKIAYDSKTTCQIVMQFYRLMYVGSLRIKCET